MKTKFKMITKKIKNVYKLNRILNRDTNIKKFLKKLKNKTLLKTEECKRVKSIPLIAKVALLSHKDGWKLGKGTLAHIPKMTIPCANNVANTIKNKLSLMNPKPSIGLIRAKLYKYLWHHNKIKYKGDQKTYIYKYPLLQKTINSISRSNNFWTQNEYLKGIVSNKHNNIDNAKKKKTDTPQPKIR